MQLIPPSSPWSKIGVVYVYTERSQRCMYDHEMEQQSIRYSRPSRPPARLPKRDDSLAPRVEEYLEARGLCAGLARENGWYPSSSAGSTGPRLCIPASASDGAIYWQARALDEASPRYQSPWVARRDAVVLVWPHDKQAKEAAIVEGPLDALACAGEGLLGVSLMGRTPPMAVWDHIARILAGFAGAGAVVLLPDHDSLAAGMRWSLELSSRGVAARLAVMRHWRDIAECPPADRYGAIYGRAKTTPRMVATTLPDADGVGPSPVGEGNVPRGGG